MLWHRNFFEVLNSYAFYAKGRETLVFQIIVNLIYNKDIPTDDINDI